MIDAANAFSGFSVKDIAVTKEFYGTTLGLKITESPMGLLLEAGNGNPIFIYQKDDHEPATYTILNFEVDDIDNEVRVLREKGVEFEQLDLGGGASTDKDGVLRGKSANQGPDIAWFKDPSGNVLSLLEN